MSGSSDQDRVTVAQGARKNAPATCQNLCAGVLPCIERLPEGLPVLSRHRYYWLVFQIEAIAVHAPGDGGKLSQPFNQTKV
jgi:hypothetical protein